MRRALKIVRTALVVIAALLVVGAGTLYALSARRLGRTYAVPEETVPIPTDSVSVARGEHLARAITSCAECHGADLGGKVYADAGPLGIIAGPNLTRGRGGVGAALTDADWVRALRYGVRRDGTSLIVMPSEVYVHLSVQDLGAIVAYVRQVPPVDREVPRSAFGPLGRAMLATGRLPILVAEKTPRVALPAAVPPGPTREYGRYLADIGGCRGCHGLRLSGGRVAGPPGTPQASNLTPAGNLTRWTEADFARAVREGRRPDGSPISEFMPWRLFAGMTDEEIRALWLYLRSVPPVAFGNR